MEIDSSLYEKLQELSNVYEASINKLVNVAIIEMIETNNVNLYDRAEGEILESHNFNIREGAYKELERLRYKHHLSIYKLVNIAIYNLPLFNFIEVLLKEYKAMYAEYKKIFGNTYNNDYKDYVCLMPNGELMKPGYLSHTFLKRLEDNELKRIRLHDLRHSCATLLIQNKVPIKDIQIWLGHSNIQTTMIYTHLDETKKYQHKY